MIKLNIRRFASGTINLSIEHPSSSVTFQGKEEWSSTPNSSNNTSSVTVKLYARKQGSSQATSGTFKGKIGIAGTNHSFSQSKSVGNSWVLIATVTQTVEHNNDGTKSITVSGEVGKVSGTTLANINSTGSGTATLDRIQRASTLNSVVFNITTTNGVTTGTVTANFSKYISTYYDSLEIANGWMPGFAPISVLTFNGITSGQAITLSSAQLQAIEKNCVTGTNWLVHCRLHTKTSSSGTSVGYSNIYDTYINLPDYTISIDSFTLTDAVTTYDNFKLGTDKNKTLIANLSSPTFTFSASSSTGDTYYYPIAYTLNTTYNPDPDHPDWYSGDTYNNITSPYVLNPIAISSGMPFSLIANQGGYRYEKGDSSTIDDVTVIDYQYPYAYCTFTRPTPTSTTINISGNISWYDGTGLQNLGTKSTTITYRINGVEQTKTIASNEYGTITTDGAHISRCSFTTTITIGASDYKYPISYSIQMTDLLGVASEVNSGQIPSGESLWYGYEDSNRNLHMVVNGALHLKDELNMIPKDEDNELETATYYHRFPLFLGYDGNNLKPVTYADDIEFERYLGTSSYSGGYEMLRLGNNITDGTEGSKVGRLRLFGTNQYRTDLRVGATNANRIIYLPNHDGTLVNATKIYNSSSGVSTTFALDETSANFDVLEFLCSYNDDSSFFTTRVIAPNGKKIQICAKYDNGTYLYDSIATYTISGVNVTKNDEIRWRFATSGSPTRTPSASNIKIWQVWGYKFS